jgi:hypothetical protein
MSEENAVVHVIRCACVTADPQRCVQMRYNLDVDDEENTDACQCPCHYDEEL